jgi:LAS superfamily LD-carboxypeptidase LdcB
VDQDPSAARPPEPAPAGRRLAWVNPARCLPSCGHDPTAALVRVNERAEEDPRGAHRVEATALAALRELLAAARAAGHAVRITSAFRGYAEQARLFRSTKEEGRAARPGHSEHQLGTTIDLRLPTSAAIAWLAEHAAGHGFAVSYPEGKQRLTGYRPEPWHIRYVGRDVAEELARRGWTLEELFRQRPELAESGRCDDCPSPLSRAPCGRVTDRGLCRGTVLVWCYEGALAAVDCASSKQTCRTTAEGSPPDCVTPASPVGAPAKEAAGLRDSE